MVPYTVGIAGALTVGPLDGGNSNSYVQFLRACNPFAGYGTNMSYKCGNNVTIIRSFRDHIMALCLSLLPLCSAHR